MYEGGEMVTQAFSGTPQFLSPEITEGIADFLGSKVDVWACGVTLYNMISGKYPFEVDEEANLLALYERITSGVFKMPDNFDADLQDLLKGMLRKNPATRLTVDEVGHHPWLRAFHGQGGFRQSTPILTYPITETDAVSTPTSPIRDQSKAHQRSASRNLKRERPPPQITPCETTMIPYLEELYAREIEEDLAANGKLQDLCSDLDAALSMEGELFTFSGRQHFVP
ncbi:Serine/threonine-protein kinase stk11 [Irineochytrium annulatum]|nr:Serine/threonine-protein kinase stk11 [Irineochytrium annulatum]